MKTITKMAINLFKKIQHHRYKADELEAQLNAMISLIPDEDLEEYYRVTQNIINEYNEKREKNRHIRKIKAVDEIVMSMFSKST